MSRGLSLRARWPYFALAAVYVLFRSGSFTNQPDRVTDTPTYEHVAALHLWSWRFWAGERGFTLPLFFKIFTTSESRIVAQLVFSIVAWIVLAAVVARCVSTRRLKPVAFAIILGVSLTTEVILWDTLLFSESITLALTALVVAAWIVLVREPRARWAVAVLVLMLVWAFARDTNVYVCLFTAMLLVAALVRGGHRGLKAGLAAGLLAIFVAGYASADSGKRWVQPLRDIVAHRVIPDPAMRSYFVRHGLDLRSNWPVAPWLERHGRSTYVDYLLAHPGYALVTPFHGRQPQALYSSHDNAASLLSPNLTPYNDNASHRFLPLPRLAERLLYPHGVVAMLVVLFAVLAGAAFVGWRTGVDTAWLVPLGILATTYPHFLVAFHLSGLEVDRHAFEAALLLRLAVFILAVLALDRALTTWKLLPGLDSNQQPSG